MCSEDKYLKSSGDEQHKAKRLGKVVQSGSTDKVAVQSQGSHVYLRICRVIYICMF
jgi:hypothetical protein